MGHFLRNLGIRFRQPTPVRRSDELAQDPFFEADSPYSVASWLPGTPVAVPSGRDFGFRFPATSLGAWEGPFGVLSRAAICFGLEVVSGVLPR